MSQKTYKKKSASKKARGQAGADGGDLILVLGMHRSGTSALAGALSFLGVEVGTDLVPPSKDNPRGYFENLTTVLAQEGLFEAFGYRWHDPRSLPADWLESEAAVGARAVLAAVVGDLFADTDLAAIKDPRSCRLVPLWRSVAKTAGVNLRTVLVLRHPDEVAASLHRRDGMSRTRAYLLWSRHILDAERETRALPRVLVRYEALLENWRSEMDRIGTALEISLPKVTKTVAADVDGFLDGSLRRHVCGPHKRTRDPFEGVAVAIYELATACIDGSVKDPKSKFDQLALKLETLAQPYVEAVEDSLSLEVPVLLEEELKTQGLDKSRVDMALQLTALREIWRPATLARPQGACKLYYRDESALFSEARTVTVQPVAMENAQLAVFDLPAAARVDHLRIDPDDAPGVFAIHAVSVGGEVIDDLDERVTAISELKLPASYRAPIRFAALGDDPHFELNARDFGRRLRPDGVMRVEMIFRSETVASQLTEQIEDFGLGIHRSHRELSLRQRDLIESVTSLSSQMSSARESLAAQLTAQIQESILGLQSDVQELKRNHGEMVHSANQLGPLLSAINESLTAVTHTIEETQRIQGVKLERVFELAQETQERVQTLMEGLAGLRDQQAALLNWALRRSPRYWWNRILDRMGNNKMRSE